MRRLQVGPGIWPGDWVLTFTGKVHWEVVTVESMIDPLGVLLKSGQTGRIRRDTYSNLKLFKKGPNHA